MARRAESIAVAAAEEAGASRPRRLPWAGTFHSIANRVLRLFADAAGLDPSFTVLDRSDSADLLSMVRAELGFAKQARRFPKKATCLRIYSRVVNAQEDLELALENFFPWCLEWKDELRQLFRAYVEAKTERGVLDYDDLLLYWYYLMEEPPLAKRLGELFDHVLVDEYQDTNALQASILTALKPTGRGMTAVGDDAQAIYGFRAASVDNILEYPRAFEVPARIVTLERNYRSTQPILEAANAVIAESKKLYHKELYSDRRSVQRPFLATVEDESEQVRYVVEHVLGAREAGVALMEQAVLFRTAHHSDQLEVELGRRNIPYHKYGGLKFLEAAHVKDLVCILRWAENPRDSIAGFRVAQLLPGIGPRVATKVLDHLHGGGFAFSALANAPVPSAATELWEPLCELMVDLGRMDWTDQIRCVRTWFDAIIEQRYDAPGARQGDLDQLQHIGGGYQTRERFLSELTLDPPTSTGDFAGPPHLDEDFLILSTIHSAKGQEWDHVYLLNLADGCIPSDMATGSPEQIEEERRLLYVAMTRAKSELHLVHPVRFFVRQQRRHGDRSVMAPLSRFLSTAVRERFERVTLTRDSLGVDSVDVPPVRVDVAAKVRQLF